jgi:predicted CXXCH cytochrome family protein
MMLINSVPTLCFDCHGEDQALYSSEHAHSPVKDGNCLACHEKHSGSNASLLKVKKNQLCYSCHSQEKSRFTAEAAHKPVADGECFRCHDSHATENNAMLTRPENELCRSCHALATAAMKQAHHDFPLEEARCANCHDPHSTPKTSASLLYPDQHDPFKLRNCLACHSSNESLATKSEGKDLCMQCHSKAADLLSRKNVHAALTMEGECSNCHSSHAGFTASFLNKDAGEICYTCHEKEKFAGKFVHKPILENCSTCHDVHSSDYARLLNQEDEIQLCLQCHDADKTHMHPMGKDFIDPKTGGRLVCSSCHSPHSSDYEFILHQDKQRGLCILCHAL